MANKATLHSEIESALSNESATYWALKLGAHGVPADLVVPPEALFDDKQEKEVGMLLANPDKKSAVKWIPGLPIKINGVRPQIYRSAPHKSM